MKIPSVLFLLGGFTASAAVIEKRTQSPFHLYAYGTGNAFVGNDVPAGSNVNSNITFVPTPSSEWLITPTSNITLTNTTSPALFINPSATSLTNVGFSGCGPANGTTKGFVAFGNWAMWRDLGTQKLSSSFYATPVSEGVWQLMWNAQEIDDGKSVSVAVRKVAPSS
ncbi:hypothetical protein EYC80_010834 [Monilinia laxa]|uniref:Ubiquitin 3 binding protein But2 C-terminal domain-containing protein n=1 Tax=Monilinia laxa TaxID=61186 RepID=A0A5N6JPB0_MONLA|nr:hypothetical protein EYC80_010834 [Monilinia laxa]